MSWPRKRGYSEEPVAKDLRTPKYKQRKVESKKKYKRKRKLPDTIWTTMAKKKFYTRMRDDTRDRQSIYSRTI